MNDTKWNEEKENLVKEALKKYNDENEKEEKNKKNFAELAKYCKNAFIDSLFDIITNLKNLEKENQILKKENEELKTFKKSIKDYVNKNV